MMTEVSPTSEAKRSHKTIHPRIRDLVLSTSGVMELTKDIRVSVKERRVQISIHISVVFGKPIPEIAKQIQNKAKDLFLRDFSQYQLEAVNIWVDSVRFPPTFSAGGNVPTGGEVRP